MGAGRLGEAPAGKEERMLRNDIEYDVKRLCLVERMSQKEIAEKTSISLTYINRIINKKAGTVVKQSFVRVVEMFGYDIELRYVKRDA